MPSPQLIGHVIFEVEFEKTLSIIPKDGDLVVIASEAFHDERDVLFNELEKDGDRLAQEIKKINPRAKVYIFSTYQPRYGNIDGFFKKANASEEALDEIVEIFKNLGLDKL